MINMLAAWVGLSVPISIAVGKLLQSRMPAVAATGPTPSYDELFRRAFGKQPAGPLGGSDAMAQPVQLCMN